MSIHCEFENGGKAELRHTIAGVMLLNETRDKILLARRSPHMVTEPGKWTILAGFMEKGQTTRSAALDECMQESGYTADLIGVACIADDPNRADNGRQNVGVIFVGIAGEQVGEPDDESTEQQWFPLDALPPSEEMAFDYEAVIAHYQRHGVVEMERLFLES